MTYNLVAPRGAKPWILMYEKPHAPPPARLHPGKSGGYFIRNPHATDSLNENTNC